MCDEERERERQREKEKAPTKRLHLTSWPAGTPLSANDVKISKALVKFLLRALPNYMAANQNEVALNDRHTHFPRAISHFQREGSNTIHTELL